MRTALQKPRLRVIQEISLSPLLLVLLVLLLLLLIVFPSSSPAGGQGEQGPASIPEQVVTLQIDAQRGLHLAQQQLTLAELATALHTTSPPPAVLIQPHPDLPVQHLLEVMQALRAAGIQRTAVAPAP
jgi:biopolymer transport protein ExbD